MISILGATLFGGLAILTLLVTLGFPLGEFTLGGKHRILPSKMRIASGISFLIQLFAIFIILQAGKIVPLLFSAEFVKVACYIFAGYLSLNTIMNFFSTSKKEKYVMTPISIISAICFWITALQM